MMRQRIKVWARVLSLASIASSALYACRIESPAGVSLALFKALGAALAPFIGLVGAVGAILAFIAQAPLALIAGILGSVISAQHVKRVAAPHDGFEQAFGPDWQRHIPQQQKNGMLSRRWSWWMPRSPEPRWQRDVPYHTLPAADKSGMTQLLCDIWQPPHGVSPSGLAIVYMHGSAWHVGDKDLLTRPFFRHLAAQGHVVMDIAYRLSPQADILDMVSDVKHAVAWIKAHAGEYGVDPQRIVLGGGSAGAHLALLVAYTPAHPQLTPPELIGVDISACGVFSYYGAVDMRVVLEHARRVLPDKSTKGTQFVVSMVEAIMGDAVKGIDWRTFNATTMIGNPLRGSPEENPDLYTLASPITHVGRACPPTLLFQGEHDFIMPSQSARELHCRLTDAGVLSVHVEFPQTNHGFDLFFVHVSPSAQAAIYDLERFLALLV